MNLDPFYNDPSKAAMPYLNQIPGTITPYFQPYINAGQDALTTLIQNYTQLLQNPGGMVNQIGQGYQQSPGYGYQQTSAMNAANTAAAAGGSLGTPQHQQQAAQQASDIANQDYQQYLNHALGLYGKGLQGEQGINQMGYGASTELAQDLASNLASQGSLAFQGAEGQNAANASMVKLASEAVGGLLGGVPGASIAAGIPTSSMSSGISGYGSNMGGNNLGTSLGGQNLGASNSSFFSNLAAALKTLFG